MGHITDQYGPYWLMNNEQWIMNNYLKPYKTYKPSSPTLGGALPASAWFPTIRHQRFTARQARPSRGCVPTGGTRVLCVAGRG